MGCNKCSQEKLSCPPGIAVKMQNASRAQNSIISSVTSKEVDLEMLIIVENFPLALNDLAIQILKYIALQHSFNEAIGK